MLVKVQNLGTLQTAETDLSKDLIVFCGGNNSGKTYMLNFLYGILHNWLQQTPINILDAFLEKGTITLDIADIYSTFKTQKKEKLPLFTEIASNNFDFEIQIAKSELFLTAGEIHTIFGYTFKISAQEQENTLTIETIEGDISKISNGKILLQYLLGESISYLKLTKIQFFTAERQSCLLFSHEIFKAAFDSVFNPKLEPKLIYYASYPMALLDELSFVNDFIKNREKKSDFEYLAAELENLIGGKISSTQDGALKYKQSQSKAQLNMVAVSSTIKSLASFIFYFRHVAQKGDCIIVDEPELSLHPDNQRKFARFLCRCVNEGFKVIISTHSDYIISEINNLITLHNHKDTPRTKAIMKKYGYKENQTIDYQRVGAYLFRAQKNELIPMTKQGFSVETIDNEIDNLADASDDIANNFDNLEF